METQQAHEISHSLFPPPGWNWRLSLCRSISRGADLQSGKGPRRCEGQRAAVQPDTQQGDGWWRQRVKTNNCPPSRGAFLSMRCSLDYTGTQCDIGKACGHWRFASRKGSLQCKTTPFCSMVCSKYVAPNSSQMKSAVHPSLLLLMHFAESDVLNMHSENCPLWCHRRQRYNWDWFDCFVFCSYFFLHKAKNRGLKLSEELHIQDWRRFYSVPDPAN